MLLLADESCDFSVVRALRVAGHDVKAVMEIHRGAPDEEVIQLAIAENRVLLTEDKDFGQLIHAAMGATGGVVFIRFPSTGRKALPATIVELFAKHGAALAVALHTRPESRLLQRECGAGTPCRPSLALPQD